MCRRTRKSVGKKRPGEDTLWRHNTGTPCEAPRAPGPPQPSQSPTLISSYLISRPPPSAALAQHPSALCQLDDGHGDHAGFHTSPSQIQTLHHALRLPSRVGPSGRLGHPPKAFFTRTPEATSYCETKHIKGLTQPAAEGATIGRRTSVSEGGRLLTDPDTSSNNGRYCQVLGRM